MTSSSGLLQMFNRLKIRPYFARSYFDNGREFSGKFLLMHILVFIILTLHICNS